MRLPRANSRARRQAGYMLLAVLLMMTLLILAMAAAAPHLAMQIKRNREEELIHRGMQYARAIKRYYRKTGRYPVKLEDLENTANVRFLRKRYKDPITGKDEWTLVHFGEATTPLASAPGGLNAPAAPAAGASAATALSAGAGPAAAGGSALGTGGLSIEAPISTATSTVGTPVSQLSRSPGGSGSQTFGGGPIIGVASTSEVESLKEINGTNHYNQWLFVYDARFDQGAAQQGGIPGATTPGQGGPGRPGLPGFGGPGAGGTGGPGGPPNPPPQPPRPPQ
jgi:type II secretory pathway pseudopilin PulG